MKLITTKDYLLLIDEKAEINTQDAVINLHNNELHFALEECLHKDNNCKKVTAYYPLTKDAKELDLPLLPSFEEDDIERLAKYHYGNNRKTIEYEEGFLLGFDLGYKSAQSQSKEQYSLDDMKKAIEMARTGYGWDGNINVVDQLDNDGYGGCVDNFDKEFKFKSEEEILRSLSTQQLPSEFIPECINTNSFGSETNGYDSGNFIPKTITNSEGKQELVGIYKY